MTNVAFFVLICNRQAALFPYFRKHPGQNAARFVFLSEALSIP